MEGKTLDRLGNEVYIITKPKTYLFSGGQDEYRKIEHDR
jgi:hypothetical protein